MTYEIEFGICQGEDRSVHIGESSQNLLTRGLEHTKKYEGGKADSFLLKHQLEKHQGGQAVFSAKVTGKFKDCLSMQVAEVRGIQSEILRG